MTRYVPTFKPGTPGMFIVGMLVLAGALVVSYLAFVIRAVDCGADSESECSQESLTQLVIACVGVAPAVGMVVASARRRGHPWRWFLATVVIHAFWIIFILR